MQMESSLAHTSYPSADDNHSGVGKVLVPHRHRRMSIGRHPDTQCGYIAGCILPKPGASKMFSTTEIRNKQRDSEHVMSEGCRRSGSDPQNREEDTAMLHEGKGMAAEEKRREKA